MRVEVVLLTPDGRSVTLRNGAIIGRMPTATLCIPDPRVSEAHALVSLRGSTVKLLGLRGRFFVEGQRLTAVDLAPGLEVELARDVTLRIVDVRVPEAVFALQSDAMPRQTLLGVTSIFTEPVRLESRWNPHADEVVWPSPDGWRCHALGTVLEPGAFFDVGSTRFEVVAVPTRAASDTRVETGFRGPLTIEAFYDTVHFRRADSVVLTLSGKSARVVSELVCAGCPVSWEVLARSVWNDEDPAALRGRWDTLLYRLRRLLRRHHVRVDLIRSDGTGLIELVPAEEDVLLDRT